MTQSVIATEQVQCCIQVRVDFMDSVPNSFQSHPPVWSLWLVFTATNIWEKSTTKQTKQIQTTVAAGEYSCPTHCLTLTELFLICWSWWHLNASPFNHLIFQNIAKVSVILLPGWRLSPDFKKNDVMLWNRPWTCHQNLINIILYVKSKKKKKR